MASGTSSRNTRPRDKVGCVCETEAPGPMAMHHRGREESALDAPHGSPEIRAVRAAQMDRRYRRPSTRNLDSSVMLEATTKHFGSRASSAFYLCHAHAMLRGYVW